MSARTARTRLLAAAALAAATLTLTACSSGEGTRTEGASTESPSVTSGGTSTGAGQADAKDSTATTDTSGTTGSSGTTGDSTSTSGSTGSTGSTGSSTSSGSSTSTGSSGSNASDPGAVTTPCSPASTKTTATVVSRPLNHVLLTVTNTGSKYCNLVGYPAVRFGEAQSVPPVIEDSQPQAVVTLAPGESGYAGVAVSSADGSGSNGYTAKTLEVYFNSDSTSPARPSLPAKGVYVDSSIAVTYWQSDMGDALTW